jgi:hypothetical protein
LKYFRVLTQSHIQHLATDPCPKVMAETHLNTAFGAFGSLDTLAKHCIQGFDLWKRVDNFSTSVENFKDRLGFQQAMLIYWVTKWNIDGKQHLNDPRFKSHGARIEKFFQNIYQNIRDLSDVVNSTPTAFASVVDQLKWASQEADLYKKLDSLSTSIQDLYTFTPPPGNDPAGPVVYVTSLATQDSHRLAQISKNNQSIPLLAGMAWMKSIGQREPSGKLGRLSETSPPPLESSKLILQYSEDDSHVIGTYNGSQVLTEKKGSKTARGDLDAQNLLYERVENIVLRLTDPNKPKELRTLPCLGMTIHKQQTDDTTESTYRIIYRIQGPVFSLRKLLSKGFESDIRSLGQRFLIAQTLTRAIMYLHMADWLHKAVRSQNILFVGTDQSNLRNTLPYLVGFEYSRLDRPNEWTEEVSTDDDGRLYRHPKSAEVPTANLQQPLGGSGRYKKVYDIYSMGVVLVELGFFKSVKRILGTECSARNMSIPTDEIQRLLIEKAIPKLRFIMGDTYADVALICLNGYFDQFDTTSLQTEFYTQVVDRLDFCRV